LQLSLGGPTKFIFLKEAQTFWLIKAKFSAKKPKSLTPLLVLPFKLLAFIKFKKPKPSSY
jgi:hypothetical protein